MRISRIIEAPAETVWRIFTDTTLWPAWGPSVVAVDAPERHIARGMRGTVKTSLGPSVPFEITRCDPPYRWHWKVAGVEATGHHIEAIGPSRCRASFTLPALAAPYALICKRALEKIDALAIEHAETKRDASADSTHAKNRSPR